MRALEQARKLVADDVRQSYPDLDDDDAIDHVLNTIDVQDIDLDGTPVSAAYLLVIAHDAFIEATS